MLAARDQENLRHTHQTAAANKPLNQNLRNLPSRTPGNLKTPFRASRNDENAPTGFGKPNGGLKTAVGKPTQNAFVTPSIPRNRAPLGLKTTNAKAQAFKTPAPVQQTLKPQKTTQRLSSHKRSAKSNITSSSSEPVKADILNDVAEEDEPEYGYAPPNPTPLPDPPLDFDEDDLIPKRSMRDLYRDCSEAFLSSPKDENGFSIRLKKEEEEYQKFQEERIRQSMKDFEISTTPDPTTAELNAQVDAIIAAGPKQRKVRESKPDTFKARSAAQALATSTMKVPSVAKKQTASSEQKRKPATRAVPTIKVRHDKPHENETLSSPRMVSKNTIGFPRAKKPASILPTTARHRVTQTKPTIPATAIDQSDVHPKDFQRLYGEPPVESDMWFRLREYELLEEESDRERAGAEDALFDPIQMSLGYGESDDEVFQL